MLSNQAGDNSQGKIAYGMMLDRPTRRDLNFVIFSIAFGMAFNVISGYPGASPLFTSYLKDHLGISDSAYGLILTLPFITVLIQIPYTAFVARFGRLKPAFLIAASIAKSMLLILALMPVLAPNVSSQAAFYVVVFTIIMLSIFNWIADAALNTWFGALIPSEIKGRYFSTRQMLFTFAMLIYALIMSQLLRVLADWTWKYTFFFGFATLMGLTDIAFYLRVRPPEKAYLPWFHNSTTNKAQTFSMQEFMFPLRDDRYRAYLFFAISWNFSLQIAGPYYNVYMLNTLNFTLGDMTLMTQIIPAVATILFLRKIGQAYDRYGFRPVLILSCAVSLIIPLFWLFATPASNWFLYPINVLSGIFNIGIELAIMSLAIFLAPHEARSAYIAMKNVAMSLVGFVPAILLGGFLSDQLKQVLLSAHLPFVRGQELNPFHVLLVLSFMLRMLTLLVFARRLSEPTALSFPAFVAEAQAAGQAYFREKKRHLRKRLKKFK
jgi:MFS family permease